MPRGFTLIELLITVAIIGVLSTIGIPTFRKMLQRSYQAEAKVNLGGLYRSETTFHSEFGTYGNNLLKVNFNLDETIDITAAIPQHSGRYTVGLPTHGACGAGGSVRPLLATPEGQALKGQLPGYHSTPFPMSYSHRGAFSANAFCLGGEIADNGSTYTAAASGVISPSLPPFSDQSEDVDQWTINDRRQLSHVVDGVR